MDLPKYESVRLHRSPLVLVAAQINFEDVGKEISHQQAREVQRALGAAWTRLQAASQIRTTFTPSGAVNEPQRSAYRIATRDEGWSVLVNPDSTILETRAYIGWVDMSEKVSAVAGAVADVLDPAQRLRLGLRYVDQVELPDGRNSWEELIPSTLLGIGLDPVLGPRVVGAEHRNLLQLPNDAKCMFRHGLMQDPERGQLYLLDYDVFDDSSVPFAAEDVAAAATALHDYAGSLFRASVTDELYAWLKG